MRRRRRGACARSHGEDPASTCCGWSTEHDRPGRPGRPAGAPAGRWLPTGERPRHAAGAAPRARCRRRRCWTSPPTTTSGWPATPGCSRRRGRRGPPMGCRGDGLAAGDREHRAAHPAWRPELAGFVGAEAGTGLLVGLPGQPRGPHGAGRTRRRWLVSDALQPRPSSMPAACRGRTVEVVATGDVAAVGRGAGATYPPQARSRRHRLGVQRRRRPRAARRAACRLPFDTGRCWSWTRRMRSVSWVKEGRGAAAAAGLAGAGPTSSSP